MSKNESIIDLTDIIESGDNLDPNLDNKDNEDIEEAAPSLDDLLGSLNTLREKSQNPSEEISDKPMPKNSNPLESPNTDILFDEFDAIFKDALDRSPVAKLQQEKTEEKNEIDEDSLKFILEQSLPDDDEDIEDNKIKSLDELDDLLDSIMKEDTEDVDLMAELEQASMADDYFLSELEQNNQNPDETPAQNTATDSDFNSEDSDHLDDFGQISEEKLEDGIDFEDLDRLLSSIDLPEQPEHLPNLEALKILEDLVTPNVELLDLDELLPIHAEDTQKTEPKVELTATIPEPSDTITSLDSSNIEPEIDFESATFSAKNPTILDNKILEPKILDDEEVKAKVTDPRLDELLVNFATQKSVLELMEKKILALAEPAAQDLESISAKFSSELEERFEAKLNNLTSENLALKNTITQNQERLLKLIEQNAKLELVVEGLLTKQLRSQSTIETIQTQTNELLNQSSELQEDLLKLNTAQEILLLDLEQKVASTAAKIIQEEIAQLIQDE